MANWRLIVILAVALLLAVAAVIYAQGVAAQPAETRHDHEHGRFRIYYQPTGGTEEASGMRGEGAALDQTFLLDVETGDAWQLTMTKRSRNTLESQMSWRKMPKD